MRAVGPALVIELTPAFDEHLGPRRGGGTIRSSAIRLAVCR